jgi:hypothetical protein
MQNLNILVLFALLVKLFQERADVDGYYYGEGHLQRFKITISYGF